MKLRTLAILAFFALPIHIVFGQVENFTLKDYKYPDLRRDVLNTYFDINNSFGFKKTDVDDVVEDLKENDANVGLDVQLQYSQYRQNRNWQRSLFSSIENNFDQKRENDESDNELKNLENRTSLLIRTENRRYFKNNFFVEGNGRLSFRNADLKTSSADSKNIEKFINANGLINIGVGKGRLEYVRDAHIAMYILKDLEKYELLAQPITTADYKELSDVIAQVGNERFFDGRHKRIFQLEQIDSVLQARGVLVEGNAKAFTLINDNLFFAGMPNRSSGGRLSVGLEGVYFINKSKIENDVNTTEDKSTVLSRGAYVAYNLEIPASLLIQHSFSARAEYLFATNEFRPEISDFTDANIYASLNYSLGLFPNTRTNFSVYGDIGGEFRNVVRNDAQPITESKVSNIFARIGAQMYYYVSPQFRLSGSYRLSRNSYKINIDLGTVPVTDTGTTINTNTGSHFQIGLDYFFF